MRHTTLLFDGRKYPIRPCHINAKGNICAFGDAGQNWSACLIVRFYQKRGNWKPFTKAQIDAEIGGDFCFNGLNADGFIVSIDGKYLVTHEFVSRCFAASPVIGTEHINKGITVIPAL
jgi:hypothetical protein